MRHPLANPSLAPYGFTTPRYRERLRYKPQFGGINPEKIIVRMWTRANRLDAPQPRPVETIIHEIMPGVAQKNRLFTSDFTFDGLPYASRDILVLSAFVQWFGTNVGSCFIETDISKHWTPKLRWFQETVYERSVYVHYHPEREFLLKFEREQSAKQERDLVVSLTHICDGRCGKMRPLIPGDDTCRYDPRAVSPRDRALVDGLMRWLGQPAGRTFIAQYFGRRKRAWDSQHKLTRKNILHLQQAGKTAA